MPAYRIIVPSYHRSKLFVLLLLISPFFLLAVTSLSVLSQSLSPLPFFVCFSLFLSLFASVSSFLCLLQSLLFLSLFSFFLSSIDFWDEYNRYSMTTTTTRKRMDTIKQQQQRGRGWKRPITVYGTKQWLYYCIIFVTSKMVTTN